MTYKVKLEIFEGPLDLLLYLLKKEEVNIYDIPIAKITSQYLEYLNLMQLLDLKLAGEFLVVAATLMQIKSKMLLPPDEQDDEDQEEQDPRAELVRKLLEYRKFKEAANCLEEMETKEAQVFRRRVNPDSLGLEQEEQEQYFEASLFDLISAFSKILKTIPKNEFLEIIKEEYTVEKKIHDLLHLLLIKPVLYFSKLFEKAKSKVEIITTFLAILELIRLKEIVIRQSSSFSEIQIMRHSDHMKAKSG